MIASTLRFVAQKIRHTPGLRSCTVIWNFVRMPYTWALDILTMSHGIHVRLGGYSLRLDPCFAMQNWEAIETECYRAFAAAITPGDIVCDVGAHIGTYTILAAKKSGPTGCVIAYEPMQSTRGFLNQHLQLNRVQNRVIVREVCCGSEGGLIKLYHGEGTASGDSGIIQRFGSEHSNVAMVTLDSEVVKLGIIPAVIKVDVEGWELEVLKGARKTLKQHRPCLFLSLHPGPLAELGTSPEAALAWLAALGYRHEIIATDHEIHVLARCEIPTSACA